MNKNISHIFSLLALLVLPVMIAGCTQDNLDMINTEDAGSVRFSAMLEEADVVATRSDFETIYIPSDPYNMDFFIQLNCDDGTSDFREIGTYVVPSGYEGRLESKIESEALDWHNLTSPHTFYAWNVPWRPKYTPTLNAAGRVDTVQVHFYNSIEADGFKEFRNNDYLENFIGAKSNAYSYDTHGKYVDLTFHHLVSKILVQEIRLIESSGAIQENLKADVTFVGMPSMATFYAHPETGDESGALEGSGPYVGKPWQQSDDDGVVYYVDNDPVTQDWFYICPEVDFSKINYKIKIDSEQFLHYDTYYGTFDDVEFEREPGSKYDQGGDSKILHAGEMMAIRVTLIPGVGPGLKITITDWSTKAPNNSPYHTYPGLYSEAEFNSMMGTFLNQRVYSPVPPEVEEEFAIYGTTDEETGQKYFELYENMNFNSNILPIPEGYILDGKGHTITMRANNGISDTHWLPYYNLGPVRDLYITDGNDLHTIYIDKDGYVWITDPTTMEFVKTQYFLPDREGNIKGYDVNYQEGYVRQTDYYNNYIG